jgi:hypothetical protein
MAWSNVHRIVYVRVVGYDDLLVCLLYPLSVDSLAGGCSHIVCWIETRTGPWVRYPR